MQTLIRTFRTGIVLTLALLASQAQAEAGWSDTARVLELTPTRQQHFYFKLDVESNPSGCRSDNAFYMQYDSPGGRLIYHTLLEALTRDKKVRAYVTGRCELKGYAEISSLTLVP